MIERQVRFSLLLTQQFSWMAAQGIRWVLGDAWRSTDELLCPHCGTGVSYQQLLKYNGRSKVHVSRHNERCAVDIIIVVDGKVSMRGEDYRASGEHWESLGGRWGGRFGVDPKEYARTVGWDPGHFEQTEV